MPFNVTTKYALGKNMLKPTVIWPYYQGSDIQRRPGVKERWHGASLGYTEANYSRTKVCTRVLKFLLCFEILKLGRLTNWRLSCYWSWISLLTLSVTYRHTRNCRQFVFYKNKLSNCPLSLVVSLSHLSVRLLRIKISQWSYENFSSYCNIFMFLSFCSWF